MNPLIIGFHHSSGEHIEPSHETGLGTSSQQVDLKGLVFFSDKD